MAIDFYHADDTKRKHCLYSMTNSEFDKLETILALFTNRCGGLTIDPYGTTRLYQTHIEALAELVKNEDKRFKNFLATELPNGRTLVAYGD